MKPDEIWQWKSRHIGREIRVYNKLASTNSLALSLAQEEDTSGLVILAREQTAGRGQHCRSWHSPPNTSVLMSAIVDVPPHLCRPVVLTAWAAVAVCDVIAKTTGLIPTIKWPNDVLINGKKVCGILIEMSKRAVVGIGLNVGQTKQHFATAELPDASSLLIESENKRLESGGITLKLCKRLDAIYLRLIEGKLRRLERSWREYLCLIGEERLVECHDAEHRGVVTRLNFEGVELRNADGAILALRPEIIRHFRSED
jgi:BirA family biotin operon repressor/biotin-[acetyl-CoA-carboxylase] ligase